jgi:hypothetical protein
MGHNILLAVWFGGARFGCCNQSLAWRGLDVLGQAVSARTIQISRTAPMKPAPEQLTIDLHQRAALKAGAGGSVLQARADEVIEETLLAAVVHESVPGSSHHSPRREIWSLSGHNGLRRAVRRVDHELNRARRLLTSLVLTPGATRRDDSYLNLTSILREGRETANIQAHSGAIPGIPDTCNLMTLSSVAAAYAVTNPIRYPGR